MNPNMEIPNGCAVCPACNGTKRLPLTDQDAWMRAWKGGLTQYDPETDTKTCDNCGGQTMSMRALGYTAIRPGTNEGCLHKWKGESAGRCYTVYTCQFCFSRFDIDSGD